MIEGYKFQHQGNTSVSTAQKMDLKYLTPSFILSTSLPPSQRIFRIAFYVFLL